MLIPAAEGVRLREEGGCVVIPFGRHVNDKGCLFAGSIGAGATLAAYRAAEAAFAARGLAGELVAKTAETRYLSRIAGDGRAVAEPPGEPCLKPNGNRTLVVHAAVFDGAGVRGAEVTVEFVLLRPRGGV